MNRQLLVTLVVGALLYYAFLKWRKVLGGTPWAPTPAMAQG
jgi:hypothetical protein